MRGASSSSTGLGYRPALDGMRGIAILAVVIVHATGKTGGALGVNMFFVLSGFLITTLLLEEHEATGRISLRGFYERRIRRLLPALVAMLLGYIALAAAMGRSEEAAARGSLLTLTSLGNIADAWNIGGGLPSPIFHTWSLGLEDQFYLLWAPILAILIVRYGRPALALGVAMLATAVFAQSLALVVEGASGDRIGMAPDAASYTILIGRAAALAAHTDAVAWFRRARSAQIFDVMAALGVLGFLLFGLTSQAEVRQGLNLVFALLVAGLLLRVTSDTKTRTGYLKARPLVLLGAISYSLYLWHVLIFELVPLPAIVDILLALGIAAASHRFIEQRFRRRRSAAPDAPLAPVTLLEESFAVSSV
jgi:peptidoglycan/LPS O-acetylase OafA/YrhL